MLIVALFASIELTSPTPTELAVAKTSASYNLNEKDAIDAMLLLWKSSNNQLDQERTNLPQGSEVPSPSKADTQPQPPPKESNVDARNDTKQPNSARLDSKEPFKVSDGFKKIMKGIPLKLSSFWTSFEERTRSGLEWRAILSETMNFNEIHEFSKITFVLDSAQSDIKAGSNYATAIAMGFYKHESESFQLLNAQVRNSNDWEKTVVPFSIPIIKRIFELIDKSGLYWWEAKTVLFLQTPLDKYKNSPSVQMLSKPVAPLAHPPRLPKTMNEALQPPRGSQRFRESILQLPIKVSFFWAKFERETQAGVNWRQYLYKGTSKSFSFSPSMVFILDKAQDEVNFGDCYVNALVTGFRSIPSQIFEQLQSKIERKQEWREVTGDKTAPVSIVMERMAELISGGMHWWEANAFIFIQNAPNVLGASSVTSTDSGAELKKASVPSRKRIGENIALPTPKKNPI